MGEGKVSEVERRTMTRAELIKARGRAVSDVYRQIVAAGVGEL